MDLKLIPLIVCVLLGIGLVVAGVAMIYVPAAFIVGGAGVTAFGLFFDWGV